MADQALQFVPATADQILISVNPRAGRRGRGHRAQQVAQALTDRGWQVQVISPLDEIAETAARLHEQGRLRAVVGAGGDGTMHVLANTLPAEIPLAPLPLGTENLLAKYLWMNDLPAVIEALHEGALTHLDAGHLRCEASPHTSSSVPLERVFLLMVSCGFDAKVIHRLHDSRQGNITHLAYVKPILHAIRTYDYPELRLYWDLEEAGGVPASLAPLAQPGAASRMRSLRQQPQLVSRWAFAFNLPCYAWGLKFTPQASGTDGCLDVCLLQRGSLWQAFRYLFAVLRQRLQGMPDVAFQRLSRFRVEADTPVPVQVDGEPSGFLPMDIGVLPGRLRLIVPRRWAAAHHGLLQGGPTAADAK